MLYTELRSYLTKLLDKTNITDELADLFIEQGTSRVERNLRSALQRKTVEVDITPEGDYRIPQDLMSFIRVSDEHGIIPHTSSTKQSRGYYVDVTTIKVFGNPQTITIHYNAAFPRLNDVDGDYLPQASAIPEVIIYAAAVYAAIYYIDDRQPAFENMYQTLIKELKDISNELDMSGNPAMRNPYEGYL